MGDIGHTVSGGRKANTFIETLLCDINQLFSFGTDGAACESCSAITMKTLVVRTYINGHDVSVLQDGDIVSIDVGALYKGYHGDCAATFPCGAISAQAQKLIDVTKQSFFEGIRFAKRGHRVSDISHAIQTYVESNGFSVVRSFVGHGVGRQLHEEPEVPNYGRPGHGPRLLKGMTLAIEPMVNAGTHEVRILPDRWTVKTVDGSLSAHYENTVLITDGEPEILTVTEGL